MVRLDKAYLVGGLLNLLLRMGKVRQRVLAEVIPLAVELLEEGACQA